MILEKLMILKVSRVSPLLFALTLAAMAPPVKAQVSTDLRASSSAAVMAESTPRPLPDLTYFRPTQKRKLRNYFFDAFGPYPIVGAALVAGVNQAYNTPKEWGQGAQGYGERFGSDFGIAVVTTTTRYAMADAFREDTLYYRCECKGAFRRLGHAVISTVTALRGEEGHRVFSFPALVAPYAGTMTAVYGWYPGRFGVGDGLELGSYSLAGFTAENIAREFFYNGPRSLLSRLHLGSNTEH
jgi:hypothetical protein